MEKDDIQILIDRTARELMLASHQSRDKEMSDLFDELRKSVDNVGRDVKQMNKDFAELKTSFDKFETEYTSTVTRNVDKWNKSSENQSKLVWLFITALVGSAMTVIGLN